MPTDPSTFARLVGKRLITITAAVVGGVANAGQLVAIGPQGYLDGTLMPPGTEINVINAPASGNLAAGDFCYEKSDGTMAQATAATGAYHDAFYFTLTAVTSGATGTFYKAGQPNTALTNLTPGASYYLSDTNPGKATTTPPTTSGAIVQFLGIAETASELFFNPWPLGIQV